MSDVVMLLEGVGTLVVAVGVAIFLVRAGDTFTKLGG